ncbi:MAG: molecular chaperone DnaK [Bacillales bacterium]|nr:molecular chaperone DnaK [Bacillales bacterium]
MDKNKYYQILELGNNPSDLQISEAYNRLTKKYHPDLNKDKEAIKKFSEVQQAYEALAVFLSTPNEKRSTVSQEIIIGIDLGTTNSVVAYKEKDGTIKVIPNPEGKNITPSVVAYKGNGEIIVGDAAKRQAVTNIDTVSSIKRKMGTSEKIHLNCLNKDITPQEVSAQILAYIKQYAEDFLGQTVHKAVITVPAYFNDVQRTATRNAGQIAGLEVIRIINEPTASALAYGLNKKTKEKIIVYDLGGGTFDVSVMDIGEGTFKVKATCGDNHLGGDDWDKKIEQFILKDIFDKYKYDASKDRVALQRIRDVAEKAKIELSASLSTYITLPFIGIIDNKPISYETPITRSEFEDMTAVLLNKTRLPLLDALADSNLTPSSVDQVLLVGGSTRMPAVNEVIKDIFKKPGTKTINPDEAVAVGAAIQAGIITGSVQDILLLDVTPLTLGIEDASGVMVPVVNRNTTIPTVRYHNFTTISKHQNIIEFNVYQGERALAKDNMFLGSFTLNGIFTSSREAPSIEVTFTIDANGILNVKAKDARSGIEKIITITGYDSLEKEQIQQMIRNAEEQKLHDEIRKKEAILIYGCEQSIKTIEKLTSENELEGFQVRRINRLVAIIKKHLKDKNYEILEKSLFDLDEMISQFEL